MTQLREAPGPDRRILPTRRDRPLPLSFAQEGIWVLSRLFPSTSIYNVPSYYRVSGPLDTEVLAAAVAEILARHEALRTVIARTRDGPRQLVQESDAVGLPCTDLGHLPEPEQSRDLDRWADAVLEAPFDLEWGPLFRAELARLGPNDHRLAFGAHHLVFDGLSASLLDHEVRTLYRAFAAGDPSPLPAPAIQYGDFTVWQREQLAGPRLDRLLGYWRGQLAGAPDVLTLSTDRRRGLPGGPGDSHSQVLPPELADGLGELVVAERASMFMVLLAAFYAVLARQSGQDDIVVAVPFAGRTVPAVRSLIGLFVNILPIRIATGGDLLVTDLLRQVRDAALGAFQHSDLPFELLVKSVGPARLTDRRPLTQVTCNWLDQSGRNGASVGHDGAAQAAFEPIPIPGHRPRFDLECHGWKSAHSVGIALTYPTNLFDRSTVEGLLQQIVEVLDRMVSNTRCRVSDLVLA